MAEMNNKKSSEVEEIFSIGLSMLSTDRNEAINSAYPVSESQMQIFP